MLRACHICHSCDVGRRATDPVRQCIRNLEKVLKHAGTDLRAVVKVVSESKPTICPSPQGPFYGGVARKDGRMDRRKGQLYNRIIASV